MFLVGQSKHYAMLTVKEYEKSYSTQHFCFFFSTFLPFKELNYFLLSYLNTLNNSFHYYFYILFKYSFKLNVMENRRKTNHLNIVSNK
jgi:hypothetical protein